MAVSRVIRSAVSACAAGALVLLASSPGAASVPPTQMLQGYLTDLAGQPRTGTFQLEFRMFAGASGGAPLWQELHAAIPVEDGLYAAELGSVTPFPPGLFSGVPLWLETAVNDTTLTPRRPILSVAYALRAATADSAVAAASAGHAAVADSAERSVLGNSIESVEVSDGTLTDADLAPGAAIAGTKVAADFGAQEVRTLGDLRGATARVTAFEMPPGAVAGRVLTTDGAGTASWQPVPTSGVGGGGTAGTIPVFTGGSTLGNSVLVESGGNVGIGTPAPAARLHASGLSPAAPSLIAQGVAGQTANLAEFRNSSGAVLAAVGSSGAFSGSGAGLANLNASSLTSGFVPSARLSGTYTSQVTLGHPSNSFAGTGTGLTGLNASNISTGTLNIARLPPGGTWNIGSPLLTSGAAGTLLYQDGANGRLGIGTTLPQARLQVVPVNGGQKGAIIQGAPGQAVNLMEWQSSSGSPVAALSAGGALMAAAFSGDGSGLTGLNASNVSYGTLPTANLPSGGTWSLGSGLGIDSGTLYVDPLNNRVGIGTTAPTKTLTIVPTETDYDIITAGTYGLDITTQGGDGGAITISTREASSSGIAITTSNNVGIGTVTPVDKLTVNGTFSATGAKNAIVPTRGGMTRLYSEESSEVWFSDYGAARLREGHARIDLDPLFLETVTVAPEQPLKVFVQLRDDCNGVYVRSDARGFDVFELRGGRSDAAIDYRVVAKRKGYETERLETAPPIAGR